MAKTERVELRIDEELLERVDRWIEDQGEPSSRSDALRNLVEIGLEVARGKTLNLSAGDKLNFMLLRDLVKHLNVKTETHIDLVAEAIYGGHYWAPAWEMPGLFHNYADRPRDVSFVVDVLDMWSFIEEAIERLTPEDLDKLKAGHHGFVPQFSGFDGNNETELMGIARFLVEELNRFARFKGREFNSHCPTLARHRKMLDVFLPMRKNLGLGRRLAVEDILAIVARD